jgi:predicted nucleotidyltransferase
VQRILLFGSFQKGNYTPESDVDLMVILDNTTTPFMERRDIFINYYESIPLDVNLNVYTEDEIQKMLKNKNVFMQEVMSHAREL